MKKRRGIGVAGLTLVELIISMAILAVVGTAIGGAMYVSSRSYTRGASEVNVQEEAQVASNLICDWIIDATSVNPDGSGGYVEGSSTSLVIIHPEGDRLVEVTVSQSGDELVYEAKDVTDPSDPSYGGIVGSGILAKNLTGCVFYSTFGTDRNVKISLDFSINERTYRAVTDSTSRSHDFISTGGTSTLGAPSINFELVSMDGGPHVTLEPGQNSANSMYTFYVRIDGCDPDTLNGSGVVVSAPASAKTEIVSCTRVGSTNKWKVVVKSYDDAVNDDPYIFSASNMAGSDSKTLAVRIRRVNSCTIDNYTLDPSSGKHYWVAATGTTGYAGSTYTSTVTLNASNWQEETNIVGADIAVPGANGFDASPWNYVDPTELDVKFVSYSSGNARFIDRSSDIQSWSITPGANPILNVKLKNTIDYPIAVVVTAVHSGSISGNINNVADPHCGVSVASNNKAKTIDGRTLNYGPIGPSGSEAYYDVIYISAGGDNPIPNVGGGIRRGVPACMVAEWDDDFKNYLITKIKQATGLTRTQQDIEWNNGSSLKYCTVLKYRPINPATGLGYGDYQTVVVSNITNWDNLWSDYNARRLRDKTSSIFKLDTAYEVEYDFDVYYKQGGTWVKKVSIPQTGSVVAATPYVYDPNCAAGDTVNFKNGKYTFDNPLHVSGTPGFGLFVDGVMFNNQKVGWVCEYYDAATNTWKDAGDDIVVTDSKEWCEGPYTCDGVYYTQVHLADGRTYNVGPYNENEPKHNNLNTNLQFFDIKSANMVSGRIYRVRFETDWKEYSNVSPGIQGGGSDDIVKVSNEVTNHYTLNGDMYFTK